ncbi:hypothetical protein [Mammaliicoccus sciuri]|uniref:hypothetical protein n=1 Tax=Mammaliicoccus sciuri TaxID=1296 RepID=UPI000E681227|nr:hypothetical protein [Mammaliicoccus sciuri]RIN79454.1 hypothetical protein BU007_09165 [Mammaliicoccus sciuri]
MPTIKTKKEMNLGELICWAIDNKKQARFRDFSSKSMRVRFNDNAKPEIIFDKRFLPIEQTFKVEVEEQITEDTMIPHLYDLLENNSLCRWSPATISDLKTSKSRAFYIMNDDMTMTLIWRDGKLVE